MTTEQQCDYAGCAYKQNHSLSKSEAYGSFGMLLIATSYESELKRQCKVTLITAAILVRLDETSCGRLTLCTVLKLTKFYRITHKQSRHYSG